jgi:phage-related protein
MAGNRTLKLSILADVDDLNKKLKAANGDVEKSASGLEKFGKVAGAAFLAAAAAAGAYAVKIGVDGVKAALADEQSQVKLASALENATKATKGQIAATEQSIDKMARATGVADDTLRPALARLALSTGNVSKAQDLLSLALDISTQTGKPLEAVANSLGKAYDGNSAALGRLGIGLTAAELKAMSFTEVQTKLTDLFGGAAAKNAETFQGRMDRLKIAFDEGVETIGYKLLPIIQKLIDLIVNKVIPDFNKFIKLFDPLKQAIDRNKESFQALGEFLVDYIVPVFTVALAGAINFVARVAGGVVDIIGGIINVIRNLVSGAIDGINAIIRAYNSIPILGNIPTISNPSFTTPTVSAPKVTPPSYTAPSLPSGGSTGGGSTTGGGGGGGAGAFRAAVVSAGSAATDLGSFNVGSFRKAEAESMGTTINLTVTGAFDKEGTARTIVDTLNNSYYRGTGGAGNLQIA